MLTTSGSTGLPKIVPLRGGVDAFTDWAAEAFEIRPGTVVANYAPLNFDLTLLDIWTTLKHGGCVALVDQDRATQGAYLADLVNDNEVNVLQAVPMLYRLLIDVHREDGRTFPSVRHVITTGDKIPPSSLAELPTLFPNARFYNVYGCTETNDSLMHEFLGLAEGNVPSNIPVGQPLPGVIARVQSEDGSALEGTGTGEFMVWTPFQTRGYLNVVLQRREVRLARATTTGRTDLQVRATSFAVTRTARSRSRVAPTSTSRSAAFASRTQVVEQAIQEHPAVVEVAVIAVPDELAGARLHAIVRREADQKLNSLQLRQHCATRLARTEMPSTIRDRDRAVAQDIDRKSRPQDDHRRAREESREWMRPPRRSRSSSSRSSCRTFPSRISKTTSTCSTGGVVDSLGLLKVVAWLEDEFDIGVDDSELGPDSFRTVAAIKAYVDQARDSIACRVRLPRRKCWRRWSPSATRSQRRSGAISGIAWPPRPAPGRGARGAGVADHPHARRRLGEQLPRSLQGAQPASRSRRRARR